MSTDKDVDAGRVLLSNKERARICVFTDFWQIDPNILSHFDKSVFIALKRYATLDKDLNYTKDPYPGIRAIIKDTGISSRVVQKSLDHLENLGFIKKIPHEKGQPGPKSTIYVLNDTAQMCSAKSAEEAKQISQMSEEELYADILRKKGWKVEPPEETRKVEKIKEEPLEAKEKEPSKAPTIESSTKESNSYKQNNTKEAEPQEFSQDFIKEIISFEALVHDFPQDAGLVDDIKEILYDTINTDKEKIRVGGESKSAKVVRSRLLKLNYDMIVSVLSKFKEQSASNKIKYVKSYLLSMLYTEPTQYSSSVEASYRYNS